MARKHWIAFIVLTVSLCCLLSCGLEDFLYLDYVPDEYVYITDVSRVTVRLPDITAEGYAPVSSGGYFTNFVIFYRIYISGHLTDGTVLDNQDRSDINPRLDTDFVNIYNTTDKTSTMVNTSNLESYFYNRNYYRLTLADGNINSILSTGSLGRTLEISFDQTNGAQPVLRLDGGTPYILQRAVDGPAINFRPEPDRFFLNHDDLYDSSKAITSSNASTEVNADVFGLPPDTTPDIYRTYVSMYIFAVGSSYLTTIYSQPTFIGVFRLAQSF